jgi:hypothetical protein
VERGKCLLVVAQARVDEDAVAAVDLINFPGQVKQFAPQIACCNLSLDGVKISSDAGGVVCATGCGNETVTLGAESDSFSINSDFWLASRRSWSVSPSMRAPCSCCSN